MRRRQREQHATSMFRGAELARLMTGILMLAVLYMLIARARDVNTWRWLANDGGVGAPSSSHLTPLPKGEGTKSAPPRATGPTDEDPDQAETAREEFQAITDGTLKLGPEEMEPYDRLVEWVNNQSFARLRGRAKSGAWYTDLYDAPEKHRGELLSLDLEVRRAKEWGKNRYGVPLHEAWATTGESRGRLYDVIVVGYPAGMPVGYDICEKAGFVGYFLKLQGYESAGAKPGQATEKAPLLIGRLQWEPVAAPPVDNTQEWVWGLALLAILVLALGLHLVYSRLPRRRPTVRSAISDAATGEVVPIDQWLDRAGFGAIDDEDRVDAEEDDQCEDGRCDDHGEGGDSRVFDR
jgi:hypothetical protein